MALTSVMPPNADGSAPAAPPLPGTDMTSICFRDQLWLNTYPLDRNLVFDYFALSPFYDWTCNNEQLRSRAIHPLDFSHISYVFFPSFLILPLFSLDYDLDWEQITENEQDDVLIFVNVQRDLQTFRIWIVGASIDNLQNLISQFGVLGVGSCGGRNFIEGCQIVKR